MNPWKVAAQLAARALSHGPTEAIQAAAVTAAVDATSAQWSWLVEPAPEDDGAPLARRRGLAGRGIGLTLSLSTLARW